MAMLKSKPFWQSSTLWINGLGVLVVVLELVVNTNLIPDADVVAILVAVLNIVNRFRVKNTGDVQRLSVS